MLKNLINTIKYRYHSIMLKRHAMESRNHGYRNSKINKRYEHHMDKTFESIGIVFDK